MNVKLIFTSVVMLFILCSWAESQEQGQRTGRLGQAAGQSKQHNAYKPSNKTNSSHKGNRLNNTDGHKSFHKKHHNKYTGKNYGKGHYYKHGKHYNKYSYYYPNYYGYYPYQDSYVYYDPLYPYGYGTTLGTVLERPSNLEVNQYINSRDRKSYKQYHQYGDEPLPGYYSDSPSQEQVIYIWTDEDGVENYVNDLDLVPPEYRDEVRIIGRD